MPFTPASSSIAASLIWHCTVSPSFCIVNPNASRSVSCPIIRPPGQRHRASQSPSACGFWGKRSPCKAPDCNHRNLWQKSGATLIPSCPFAFSPRHPAARARWHLIPIKSVSPYRGHSDDRFIIEHHQQAVTVWAALFGDVRLVIVEGLRQVYTTLGCGSPSCSTMPSFPIATPTTSRSRQRCNRPFRSSASPGTGAGPFASFATTPACQRRLMLADSQETPANSRYLILLASPEAAASRWVDKEISLLARSGGRYAAGRRYRRRADLGSRDQHIHGGIAACPPAARRALSRRAQVGEPHAPTATAPTRARPNSPSSRSVAAVIRGMPKEDLLSQR